jgi:hypothetical protein
MWGKRHSIELMVKFAQLTSQACTTYPSAEGKKCLLIQVLCVISHRRADIRGKIRRYSGWGGRIKNREKV